MTIFFPFFFLLFNMVLFWLYLCNWLKYFLRYCIFRFFLALLTIYPEESFCWNCESYKRSFLILDFFFRLFYVGVEDQRSNFAEILNGVSQGFVLRYTILFSPLVYFLSILSILKFLVLLVASNWTQIFLFIIICLRLATITLIHIGFLSVYLAENNPRLQ